MASLKKFNGTTWDDTKVRKLGTATDTITTLPADLYADGNNATVGLKGNMQQTGTPTPSSPIQPQECGERTGNLLASLTKNYAIDASGNINSNYEFMYYTAPCEANETYTFSLDRGLSGNNVRIHAFNGDTWIEQLKGAHIADAPFTVTTPANTTNLKISITKDAETYHTMLNTGETPLPYEPYGYKLDIKSANTTTPVYLGETQTTRKIKKYEITGEENWVRTNSGYFYANNAFSDYNHKLISMISTMWSHYIASNNSTSGSHLSNGRACLYCHATSSIASEVYIRDDTYTSAADFKTYLQQQYAAGTPVTVWYVLATEETGIVNEPIRKIGDYADTVSGITIPTITGKDTFDVETTLKPSEVELTYTGWHDANVKESDGSDWQ